MNLEKSYLDLARKITKDVETMTSHLDAIKDEMAREHHPGEAAEFFNNWYTWLQPSLLTLTEAKTKIRTFYQETYPNGEPIEIEAVKPTKKPSKKLLK